MTLRAMLGLEDAPISEVAFNYVLNGPLVESGQKKSLPTCMRMLLEWYDNFRIVNEGFDVVYVGVREKHHFKEYSIPLPMSELFQLYNMRSLDKSIMACYVL